MPRRKGRNCKSRIPLGTTSSVSGDQGHSESISPSFSSDQGHSESIQVDPSDLGSIDPSLYSPPRSSPPLQNHGACGTEDSMALSGLGIRDPFRQRLVKWYKGGKPGSFKRSSKVNERQGAANQSPDNANEFTLTTEEGGTLLRKLDREIRWHSFLYHSNIFAKEIIDSIYGANGDVDSGYFIAARTKVHDNIKSNKSRMLKRVKQHVATLMSEDMLLKDQIDPSVLLPYFARKFNESNFLFCWYYMDGYLDVDRSSPMGVYFMKNHYANICTQVKIATDTENVLPHAHQRLLEFYDELPLAKEYYDVERCDFAELTERYRGQKGSKRKPAHCLAEMYQAIGPPPSKRTATPRPTPRGECEGEEGEDFTGDWSLPI
ncbi:hypothetical protein V8E54_013801 [Elaphomyces granulatus]